jgi:hypothetical protein
VQESNQEEIKKSLRQEGCSLESNAGKDLTSDWGNFQTNNTDSLFWRWTFQGISPLVLSFFFDVGLVQPSDKHTKAQWALLVCQPDMHSRQHVFPTQIHTTPEDGSSGHSFLKAVTSGKDMSTMFQDMIFFPYSKTYDVDNNPLSPIQLAGLDCLVIKGNPNAHQLSTSDVKHAFKVLVGGEVEKYVPEGLPKDNPVVLFRALLLSVQKCYSGLGSLAMVLKLIKRLVSYGSLALAPDQAQSFLQKIQLSHRADAYFLAMLSFSAEINCKLACVQGKSRILATKLAAINCVPANGAENLMQPVSFGKGHHTDLSSASCKHFIITLIASDPSNAKYTEVHNKILRHLSLTHQTNQNLAHQPCLRDFLVGIICKLKTKSDPKLISAFPPLDLSSQKNFKESVVKQRTAAASFIHCDENIEVKKIVDDFLRHSQAQTNSQHDCETITAAAVDRSLSSCAGKYPRAPSLNWLINLATQFTINAEAMEVFFSFLLISDKLDMLPSGNPLSRADIKSFPAKWDFFFKIRESLTCSIYEALTAKTKNIAVAFKHRIRLSLSASILKVIMKKDSLVLNTENYSGFPNVSAKLSSKLKGDETLFIISIFFELLCKALSDGPKNESDSFQLSDDFDAFLGASSVQLSHTIPPPKFRLAVGGLPINDDSPVYDLWHFMSAVLPKPNEYPTVWGLLNKAAEIDNGKSGGDGGKPDMNGTPGASDLGSVDTTEQSSTPESGIDQPSNTDGASFIFNEADEDTCTQDEVERGDLPSAIEEERHSDLAKREAELLKKAAELETERQELNRRKASNISDLGEMKKKLGLWEGQLKVREARLLDLSPQKENVELLKSLLRESRTTIAQLEQRVKSMSAHQGTNQSLPCPASQTTPPYGSSNSTFCMITSKKQKSLSTFEPGTSANTRGSAVTPSVSLDDKAQVVHPSALSPKRESSPGSVRRLRLPSQPTPPNDAPPSASRSVEVSIDSSGSDDGVPISSLVPRALKGIQLDEQFLENEVQETRRKASLSKPLQPKKKKFAGSPSVDSKIGRPSAASNMEDILLRTSSDEDVEAPSPVTTRTKNAPPSPRQKVSRDSQLGRQKSPSSGTGLGQNDQPPVPAAPSPPTRRNRINTKRAVVPQKRASPNENQSHTKRKKLPSNPSGSSAGELPHLYPDPEVWGSC